MQPSAPTVRFVRVDGFTRTRSSGGVPTNFMVRTSNCPALYDTIYEDPNFAVAEVDPCGIDFLSSTITEGLYLDTLEQPHRLVAFMKKSGGGLRQHNATLISGTIP